MRFTRRAFMLAAISSALVPRSRLLAADDPKTQKGLDDNKGPIDLLTSTDKAKRLAATQELFKRDPKIVLDAMRKAGAKHIAQHEGVGLGSRRIDAVYSLIAGFPAQPEARFTTTSFCVRLEKGVTRDALVEMGERHGFKVDGTFHAEGNPSCYVSITKGTLQGVLREILSTEDDVVSVNLNYVEQGQRPPKG